MKVLICGECSDPLTTVAQGLNRIRSKQISLEDSLRAASSPLPEPELTVIRDGAQPASLPSLDSF